MVKSNEELAILIKGGRSDLLPELWEQVKRFYSMKARQIYSKNQMLCQNLGFEFDDISQSMFIAFMSTLSAFDSESGLKFLSYSDLSIKNVMRSMGVYKKPVDAMCYVTVSLNEPIAPDEENSADMIETIADGESDAPFDEIAESDASQIALEMFANILHDKLSERDAQFVIDRCCNNLSYGTLSNKYGITSSEAKIKMRMLLSKVRAMKQIRHLRTLLIYA